MTKSPIAEAALHRIQELYVVEAAINGRSADQRRAERQERSKPLLEALGDWLGQQRRRLSGKAPLGKAFQYALSRWDALTRYLEDGRLSIDNNLAERLVRDIAMARKNFLFLGSDRGGERTAAIYTIVETAKLNDLDPRPISPPSSIRWHAATRTGSMSRFPGLELPSTTGCSGVIIAVFGLQPYPLAWTSQTAF